MPDASPERTVSSFDYLAAVLGWLVPGAGHLFIGQRARGGVFGLTIHALFFLGLFIGGVQSIDPPDQPIWRVVQPIAGWPWVMANNLKHGSDPRLHPGATPPLPSSMPQILDAGAVYCGIAGMLNVLVLFDAVTRIAKMQARQGAQAPGV